MRRSVTIISALALLLGLQACGGGECNCESAASGEGTSGGEETITSALRTTTPIPVPQPAVAREELSEALQSVWTHVEEAVAVRVPDSPEHNTSEEVQAWADGPFREWVETRTQMSGGMRDLATEMSDEHEHNVAERAVAAALFGYMYEDFAAGAHGAPVPENVANDPELLTVYMQHLDEELMPVVERAFDAYMYCASHVTHELSDTPWANWGLYCFERAGEIDEVYSVSMRRHFREVDHQHPADGHHPGDEHPEAAEGEEGAEGEAEEAAEEAEPTSYYEPEVNICDLPTSV